MRRVCCSSADCKRPNTCRDLTLRSISLFSLTDTRSRFIVAPMSLFSAVRRVAQPLRAHSIGACSCSLAARFAPSSSSARPFSSSSAPSASSAAPSLPTAFSVKHSSAPSAFPLSDAQPGLSYWQPAPAHGYVVVTASRWYTPGLPYSQGVQVVAPGGFVRRHAHAAQSETITVLEGEGHAIIIEGEGSLERKHSMRAGSTLTFRPNVAHSFLNDSPTRPLRFLWTITRPDGASEDTPSLEDFFKAIGKPRTGEQGEREPEPFERPADQDQKHKMKA